MKRHMKRHPTFLLWLMVSLSTIVNLLVFGFFILRGSDTFRIQYIPDDAYDYLQLAKKFVKVGYWTFDSGVSTGSGFHPFLAYLLIVIYKPVTPNSEAFVICLY
jgi:hypothetical protein